MSLSDELAYTTMAELALRIRRRELSPVEVMDATIARIEARNPAINALVFTAFDEARERAKQAEKAVTAGEILGPLHGVPVAIKDLFNYKPGWKATFGGVRALKDFAPDLPCTFVERIEAGGALALSVLAGEHRRDPFSLTDQVDFLAATRRNIRGWKIAYSPDFDIFPVDPRVAEVVRKALAAFEQAGAHVEEVKVGIKRSQQELSDLWCRLITPLNLQVFEIFKQHGVDLLKDHRDDFPPEYLRWIDQGYRMSALDFFQDQAVRTEVFDAVQDVLGDYDLLVTPTLACLPVDNTDDGNTMGP